MNEPVQVVDRVLDIIEQLAEASGPMGPTKLAEATGLNKSSVYRLLSTLLARRYVEKNQEDGTYYIGPKLIEVVSCYINSLELQTEARPYLTELARELNLTTHLGILDGYEVVYVEKLDNLPSVRLYANIGYRVPAYCSSLGKCLLSCLSREELKRTLKECTFIPYTTKTITDLSTLQLHLREVRKQGWAMDDEESEEGHRCIAAPIFDY